MRSTGRDGRPDRWSLSLPRCAAVVSPAGGCLGGRSSTAGEFRRLPRSSSRSAPRGWTARRWRPLRRVVPLAARCGAAAISPRAPDRGRVVLAAVAPACSGRTRSPTATPTSPPSDQLAELEEIGETDRGRGPGADDRVPAVRRARTSCARPTRRGSPSCAVARSRCATAGRSKRASKPTPTSSSPADCSSTRRSSSAARPSRAGPRRPYALAWQGRYYEVWQRPSGLRRRSRSTLPLGGGLDPAAPARCDDLRRLAGPRRTSRHDRVRGGAPVGHAADKRTDASGILAGNWRPDAHAPHRRGGLGGRDRPAPRHLAGLALGSVRGQIGLLIDGQPAGSVRHLLNNCRLYTSS